MIGYLTSNLKIIAVAIVACMLVSGGAYVKGRIDGSDRERVKALEATISGLEIQMELQTKAAVAYREEQKRDDERIADLSESLEKLTNEASTTDVCVGPDRTERLRQIFEADSD